MNILSDEAHFLKVLNNFAIALIEQDSVEDIVWFIAKNVIAKLDFVDCVIYLKEKDHLIQMAAHGPKNPIAFDIHNPIKIPLGEGIVGSAAISGKADIVSDTTKDSRYIIDDALRFSEITVPIIADGEIIGIIDSEHHEKNFFQPKHLEMLTIIASMAGSRIMQSKAKEALNNQNIILEQSVKNRTQELETTLEELKKLNKELENFNYSLSHDLKTPLLNAISFSEMIFSEIPIEPNSELELYKSHLTSSLHKLNELLSSISRFGMVRSSALKLEPFELQPFLEEILNDLLARKTKEEKEKITVDFLLDGMLLADKAMMYQVFSNLLSNALKFSAKKEEIKITVGQIDATKGKTIFVQDNGVGFNMNYKEKLFQLFNRLHHHDDFEGAGVGLSIVKRIMERHNGKIWAEGAKEKGATFYLWFP